MSYEREYLDLCKHISEHGDLVEDRTGTGCISIFGAMIKHNLAEGFPIPTTKKVNLELIAGELLWFLAGDTNLTSLRKYQGKSAGSRTIWSDDFEKYWDALEARGDVHASDTREFGFGGRIYGQQWRKYCATDEWGTKILHDQITTLIDNLKKVKAGDMTTARRLIVMAWNPYDHTVGDKVVAALPACHDSFQCIVRGNKLNLRFHCRSNDMFLGNPYNMASYALLCHILARLTGLEVGELCYMGTDVHLYSNHIEQVKEQMSRDIRQAPTLVLPEFNTLEELLTLKGKDFKLEGYDPHPFIKAPQAS